MENALSLYPYICLSFPILVYFNYRTDLNQTYTQLCNFSFCLKMHLPCLITGASGFIGRNSRVWFRLTPSPIFSSVCFASSSTKTHDAYQPHLTLYHLFPFAVTAFLHFTFQENLWAVIFDMNNINFTYSNWPHVDIYFSIYRSFSNVSRKRSLCFVIP